MGWLASGTIQITWNHRISLDFTKRLNLVRDQGVGGSNPLSPTNIFNNLQWMPGVRVTQKVTHMGDPSEMSAFQKVSVASQDDNRFLGLSDYRLLASGPADSPIVVCTSARTAASKVRSEQRAFSFSTKTGMTNGRPATASEHLTLPMPTTTKAARAKPKRTKQRAGLNLGCPPPIQTQKSSG